MQTKFFQKQKAVELRKAGKTYSEILKVVPVAKSTLSLWLREANLSRRENQRLTDRKLAAIRRGGVAKRRQREHKTAEIFGASQSEIRELSQRELFLIGVALYWAEGTKQKPHTVSQRVSFGNSDPNMIQCFLCWLRGLGIAQNDLIFELYIHQSANVTQAVAFWSKLVGVAPEVLLKRTYFKKGNPKTIRKNSNEKYVGLLRIVVKRSTDFNRRISGWIRGISEKCIY